jgi:hypothetical protein
VIARGVAEGEERVHPTAGEIIASEAWPSLNNLEVLAVDDEAGAREVAETILTQAQATVRTAEGASAALEILDEWRPDVLVTDIEMPDVRRVWFYTSGMCSQPTKRRKRSFRGVNRICWDARPTSSALGGFSKCTFPTRSNQKC